MNGFHQIDRHLIRYFNIQIIIKSVFFILTLIDEPEKGNLNEVKNIANNIKDNEQKTSQHGKRADVIVKGMLQHS